jgi:hypothetical protein
MGRAHHCGDGPGADWNGLCAHEKPAAPATQAIVIAETAKRCGTIPRLSRNAFAIGY